MAELPRLAVGTVQPQADSTAIIWALMHALERLDVRVQSFLSHAYFCPRDGATAITSLPPRHLDTWLMDRAQCCEVLVRGSRASDLALVEGCFAGSCAAEGPTSDFETLCQWLDLPRVAVVDARLLAKCQVPDRPAELGGVLLDRVADASELCRLQTQLEALWHVPVLGSLSVLEPLRGDIANIPFGCQPPLELCQALGEELSRSIDIEAVLGLAHSRAVSGAQLLLCGSAELPRASDLHVAVAFDEAFGGYFPDTLDVLELRGATISDFSPLRDERLPANTDVVYVGCGHPERFAEQLSRNDCLMLALQSHVFSGRRIYAECGGLAYLCRDIELPDGQRWPMVGVLPSTARFDLADTAPRPAEVQLTSDNWLGRAGETWRGYLNPRWSLQSAHQLDRCGGEDQAPEVVRRQQAVASRVYMNFAAQRGLLDGFFTPHDSRRRASTPH
ncbi:MAG: hypothetical protein DWQ37_08115 [Planctomycetota bacterium]|nr:MAG: hypothetical protein DWQ37_08115 [Planctomycetota bacterium]